ncbi:hypothetical protein DV735_g511, partial [Chaetothyriales sp. CBS 134920]
MGSMSDSPAAGPRLYITGLGAQYPAYLLEADKLDQVAKRFYDVDSPGLKRLLQINQTTGIETRSAVRTYENGFGSQSTPPTVTDIHAFYRQTGVDLTVKACRKAMREARLAPRHITHSIGVTGTNHGNPGYNQLVNQKLGLAPTVDHMLLNGVGCAGGLAIMRAAAQIALGASARGRPARILAFACELCTPNLRHDLAAAEACLDPDSVCIAGALFSDAAAAFVLCNDLAVAQDSTSCSSPLFELVEWDNATIPDTLEHMVFYPGPHGYHTTLTPELPDLTMKAVGPMFESMLPAYQQRILHNHSNKNLLTAADFDWAVHPGGLSILEGVKALLSLSDDHLRASQDIYASHGNSSSPTVLIVLDKLRKMGKTRDHIVATAFGPGLTLAGDEGSDEVREF